MYRFKFEEADLTELENWIIIIFLYNLFIDRNYQKFVLINNKAIK